MVQYAKFHGLQPDETYIVQVRARGVPNETSDSDWSTSYVFTTSGDTVAPSAPTSLSVSTNKDSLWVDWTAPTDNEDASALEDFRDYRIDLYDNASPGTKVTRYTDQTNIEVSYSWLASEFSGISTLGVDIYSRDANGNQSATPATTTGAVQSNPFDHGSLAGLSDFTADHGTEHDSHDHSAALGTASIDDLSDVDTTTTAPSGGTALMWDGAQWEPKYMTQADIADSPSINDLTDVDTATTAPTTGDSLLWDGSQWEPGTPVTDLDGLSDVDITTTAPTDQQALVYSLAQDKWIPGDVAAGGGGGGGLSGSGGTYTYAETIGNGSDTQFFVAHNLGTSDIAVEIVDLSNNTITDATVELVSDYTVKITFDVAPATDEARVIVLGAGGASPTYHFVQTVGDGSATGFDIQHDFGTEDVQVQVRTTSAYATAEDPEVVYPNIKITSPNIVRVEFNSAPASGAYRVSIATYSSLASIGQIDNVDTDGIADGDVLIYNQSTGNFEVGRKPSLGMIIALGG